MIKTQVHKLLTSWIKSSRTDLFLPFVLHARKNRVTIGFENVSSCLRWNLSWCWCRGKKKFDSNISVSYEGLCVDLLSSYELVVSNSARGEFFCQICEPDKREYFQSINELVVEHCLAPVKAQLVEAFDQYNYICMYVNDLRFSYAELASKEDGCGINTIKGTRRDVVPLFNNSATLTKEMFDVFSTYC